MSFDTNICTWLILNVVNCNIHELIKWTLLRYFSVFVRVFYFLFLSQYSVLYVTWKISGKNSVFSFSNFRSPVRDIESICIVFNRKKCSTNVTYANIISSRNRRRRIKQKQVLKDEWDAIFYFIFDVWKI